MLRSTARSKVTWVAMLAALGAGLALLVVLTSPGSHPKAAQAQTGPRVVLTLDGFDLAAFSKFDELTSTIKLPRADGTAAKLDPPLSIVLERTADNNLELSSWYRGAQTQSGTNTNYRRDVYLTFYDETGTPTQKIFLEKAWPAEYHLEQQGDQVVERVRLTANYFQRVTP
jgi:T4-like virus tail tube protein gp19